jgi:hypothetical protein
VRSLVSSAIVLVPDNCGCSQSLIRVAGQAHAAGARVYFVGSGVPSAQLMEETVEYGGPHAVAADDADGVLTDAYHPAGLTVLLVFSDATAEVRKNLAGNFQLGLTPGELNSPGAKTDARPSARANPTAGPTAG